MFIFTRFVIVLVLTTAPLFASDKLGPEEVVTRLHKALLDMMVIGEEKNFVEKHISLRPVVSSTFNFSKIARIVAGRHWRTASRADQQKFENSLLNLGTTSYVSSFREYSGHHFKQISSSVYAKKATVETVLIDETNNSIKIKYMLQKNGGIWKVINVIARGVSDLSLKRADYSHYLESGSLGSLADTLNEKANQLH